MFQQATSLFRPRGIIGKALWLILLLSTTVPPAYSQASSAAANNAQEVTSLETGKAIERELAGSERHSYELKLTEGQYANVIVEQRGIDVVVQLQGTDGKSIVNFDFARTTEGEETIGIAAEKAGSYRLLVTARYPRLPAGRYEIRLIEVRTATQEDHWLYEAHRQETACRQLTNAGKYAEALPLCEKSLELHERSRGSEHPDLAYPLLSLAAIYYFKADYAKAEAFALRGLTIVENALGKEDSLVAILLSNLALFRSSRGDKEGAELLHQRALSIREKSLGPDHPLVAFSLIELGVIYRTKGDFVRAEQFLQRAMAMQEKALGEEHTSFASNLNNLAGLYREKGDYAKAEPLYQRAVAIREKTNHPYLAVAFNNLANLYRDMGDYDKAEPLYLRSIAIKEKAVGPDHPDVADSRNNIAFLYYARGDYAKAETLYLSALATLEKALGPNGLKVALHLGHFADVYFATNDYAKAEPLYHRALSSLEKVLGTNFYQLANILINLAQISVAQGKLDEAVAYQARANAIIEYNLALNLATGSERQKLAYLAKMPEQVNQAISLHVRFANDDPQARDLAATAVLQRKGRVQDAMSASLASLRNRFNPENQALFDRLNGVTSQLARLVLNGPQSMSLAEHQKQIKALEEQREKLESEISSRSAGFYVRSRHVTLAAIQSAIPDDAALIELAVYRPVDPKAKTDKAAFGAARYVAYIIRKQGAVEWKELGDVRTIDGAVEDLRKALRDPKRKDVEQLARAVDERVMRPVRALVGDATHLLVSPDGALNLIPFEVLVDEQNRYLIERYSFNYLTSGRDLLRLQVARNSLSNSLVLADPLFGEPETTLMAKAGAREQVGRPQSRKRQSVVTGNDLSNIYFAPLGGTEREAQTIKSLFPEVVLLTRAEATEAHLKQVAAPRILHIATHGFFLTDELSTADARGTRAISATAKVENPLLRSGLALAGANLPRKAASDDGILTALEATGLNLWGTRLVVLSACDTGVGEVKNGEGVYGLRRAFVLAGAETLVMSLWPVSDYVTREMMTGYYQNLKQGQGRGEALRQVQLSMLKRKGREHPFYWASFIQSGDWADLNGKR